METAARDDVYGFRLKPIRYCQRQNHIIQNRLLTFHVITANRHHELTDELGHLFLCDGELFKYNLLFSNRKQTNVF